MEKRIKVMPLRGTVNLKYVDSNGVIKFIVIGYDGVYYDEMPKEARKIVDRYVALGTHVFLKTEFVNGSTEKKSQVLSGILKSAKKTPLKSDENANNENNNDKNEQTEKSETNFTVETENNTAPTPEVKSEIEIKDEKPKRGRKKKK